MADTEKEVYGRCADDCLFPVFTKEQTQKKLDEKAHADHNHDDRYFTQEAVTDFISGVSVYPVKITETINGSTSTFESDITLGQIHQLKGTPQVYYYQKIGETETFICTASLFAFSENGSYYTFASSTNQTGGSYFFTISSAGVLFEHFEAKQHFNAVPTINESLYNEIPNVFAVMQYAQQKPLILAGSISAAEGTVTLYSSISAEEVETAIQQGRDVKMRLTFTDEGMTGVSLFVPLVAVKNTILDFETIADVSEIAASNICSISIPVGRANLSAYAANIRKISFES